VKTVVNLRLPKLGMKVLTYSITCVGVLIFEKIFIYLFIYCVFNDALSISGHDVEWLGDRG